MNLLTETENVSLNPFKPVIALDCLRITFLPFHFITFITIKVLYKEPDRRTFDPAVHTYLNSALTVEAVGV